MTLVRELCARTRNIPKMDPHAPQFSEIDLYRFLIRLDDAIRPLVDPEQITLTAATILGQYLGVNRCAYAYVEDEIDSFTLTGNYTNGVPSIVGRYRSTNFGEEFVRLSRLGEAYVVDDAETDPRVVSAEDVIESYRATQIRAVICVPVIKTGRFVACMAVHQNEPRHWQEHEVKLLFMVANRCWESIERNRIALELRNNENRYRTLVESVSSVIWHTDANGAMFRRDASWEAFTGQSFEQYCGTGWIEAIHPEDREVLKQMWESVLRQDRPREVSYRLRRHDGQYRHVVSRAASIKNEDGKITEWVGSCTDVTESRLETQRYQEARERAERALIAGEVGTWVWDIVHNLLHVDRNIAQMFDLAESDPPPLPVEHYVALMHPEDQERVVRSIAQSVESESSYRAEFRIVSAHREHRHVLARGRIERDAAGVAIRMPGVLLDVTDRVHAEQALRESEERLRMLANTIPQMAWIANADGWIHWFNDRWYHYTGTTLEQVQGWGWQCVHDPDMLPEVKRRWEATITKFEPFEMVVPLRGADGRFRNFYTLISPLRDANGKVVSWFGTNTDITQLEEAEQALRDSEERMREGLVAARMAVWDWNLVSGEVKFAANSAEAFGISWANQEEGWNTIYPDDRPSLQEAVEKALAETGHYELTVRMIDPADKELRWVDIRGRVLHDAHGMATSVRGVLLDVTDRKRAEEALRDEHKRKDEFLAMLAHELRNPLSPISAAAQILPMISKDEKRLLNTANIISRQIGHITKIIDDLLDVSRVNRELVTIELNPVDMRAVVREAVDQVTSLIDAGHHRLTLQIPPEPARVSGDRTRLTQVVTNLLSNAAKYTPPGGDILLALKVDDAGLELMVRDNGMGLSAELLPHVFELFVQGKRTLARSQGGLGLGLSLVKNLISLHGGSVLARSDGEGKGSEFTVRLPRLLEMPESSAPESESRPVPSEDGLRIMVVDDNVDAAQSLGMLLEAQGHRIWIEYDGTSALRQAVHHLPDIFILDIGLPDMDGYALAQQLHALPGASRSIFIALSGYGQQQDRKLSQSAGFDFHLVKPVDVPALMALFKQRK